jgi:uncharacterized membrane protein YbhN (UPF0104 family)
MSGVLCFVRSGRGRLVLTAGSGVLALGLMIVVARRLGDISWSFSDIDPGLLAAAGALSLAGYGLKAYAWRQLFPTNERPPPLALIAANGGASVTSLALPGRFDDIVRIAIVRRFRDCPAGVRTLCLSLFMLGLVDAAALAPLALAAAILPGHTLGIRLGLVLLTAVGLVAALLVLALPRAVSYGRVRRSRLGCWLRPRTTSLRDALQAWALVSACWLTRAAGLLVLFGALGVGYSFTLAILFLCASSAAAALPVGPGGTATQAGAGAAVLMASGVGLSDAVAASVTAHALGIVVGGSILLLAAAWQAGSGVVLRTHPAPSALSG